MFVPCRPGRRAACRGAADPLEDERHRVRGDQVGTREEVRVGDVDAADAVVLELRDRERLEQVVPDDVAREQPLGLRRRAERPRRSCAFEFAVFWNVVGEPLDAADAKLRAPRRGAGSRRAAVRAASGSAAAATFCCSWSAIPRSFVTICGDRQARRRERGRQRLAVGRSTAPRSCPPRPCSASTNRASTRSAHDWISSAKTSTRKTTNATSASRRTSGARPRGGPSAGAAARAGGAAAGRARPAPPRWPARRRRSRTGCRRRAGPCLAESIAWFGRKGLLLGAK